MGSPPCRVLAADCPWKFDDTLPGPGRGAAKHYATLTVDELCAFPLPPLADNAALFFWRVSSMPKEALRVVRAWGFTPTSELVWNKLRRCGPCKGGGKSRRRGEVERGLICAKCAGLGATPHFGMERIVRGSHETCIIATRRKPERLSASVRSSFSALMPTDTSGKVIHSAKPELFYRHAEALYAGPRAELFARQRRAGWEGYGLELPALELGAAPDLSEQLVEHWVQTFGAAPAGDLR